MANCPSHAVNHVRSELSLIAQDVALGVCLSRANASETTWSIWRTFCTQLNQDPTLSNLHDPIPLLQLFAHRYRLGSLAPRQTPVRGRAVGDALRAVGQTLAGLGHADPRLQPLGKLEFRLSRQLTAYNKQDPPPSRVKPIPINIIRQACNLARLTTHPMHHAMADMLILGFFFLLRPGEYAYTANPDSTPFRLCDLNLMVGNRRLHHLSCSDQDLTQVNFMGLEFTNQKNGVRGEIIGLGRSGDITFCPVTVLISRVRHLRSHRAHPTTPIYNYFYQHQWHPIPAATLTSTPRQTVTIMGPSYGIQPSDISIRSLRSSGAMALLCAKVDPDRIRLLGHWRSDEMLRYLHVQAFPVVAHLAPAMLQHGHFTLIPNQPLPPLLPCAG